jgi:hypothetical protein
VTGVIPTSHGCRTRSSRARADKRRYHHQAGRPAGKGQGRSRSRATRRPKAEGLEVDLAARQPCTFRNSDRRHRRRRPRPSRRRRAHVGRRLHTRPLVAISAPSRPAAQRRPPAPPCPPPGRSAAPEGTSPGAPSTPVRSVRSGRGGAGRAGARRVPPARRVQHPLWSRRPLVQLGQELPTPKGIDPDMEDSLL